MAFSFLKPGMTVVGTIGPHLAIVHGPTGYTLLTDLVCSDYYVVPLTGTPSPVPAYDVSDEDRFGVWLDQAILDLSAITNDSTPCDVWEVINWIRDEGFDPHDDDFFLWFYGRIGELCTAHAQLVGSDGIRQRVSGSRSR